VNDHLVLLLFTILPPGGSLEFKDVPTDSHYSSRKTEKSVILLAQQSHGRTRAISFWIMLLLSAVVVALSASQKKAEVTAPEVRPVRTMAVALQPVGETVVLTGHIEAEHEAGLGFRISGRMVERLVNVGNRVAPGQVLARLDPQDEQNGLRSAQTAA
jgi:multidrug efflux pump subunit AcrA (membrane-fusion protein)